MIAVDRAREEGRRAGLLEAADLVQKRVGQVDGWHPDRALLAVRYAILALAGPAQARLDGGEDIPPLGGLGGAAPSAQEITARALFVLRAHLEAREKFFREERGVYQPPTKAARDEALAAIREALKRHHETREVWQVWRRESAVFAAGVGIFYSEPHNGELEKKKKREQTGKPTLPAGWLPKLYLELWRPWKLQKGKPDPVPGFAELCFERRREVAGG